MIRLGTAFAEMGADERAAAGSLVLDVKEVFGEAYACAGRAFVGEGGSNG